MKKKLAQWRKSPVFLIDLWFVVILPPLLVFQGYTGFWFSFAGTFAVAAIMGMVRNLFLKVFRQPTHHSLSEDDFEQLVAGEIIVKEGAYHETRLALQDIGYERMEQILAEKKKSWMEGRRFIV